MSTFWILSALLVFVGVLFIVVPLARARKLGDRLTTGVLNLAIRKDQLTELQRDLDAGTISESQFEQGRLELEHHLLQEVDDSTDELPPREPSRLLAGVLGLLLPVLVFSLYNHLGSPHALSPPLPPMAQQAGNNPDAPHEVGVAQLAGMVQGLADRLEQDPGDGQGWMMLGRSYAVLREYGKSADAYARAHAIVGDNVDLLANWAESLSMVSGGTFTPQSVELIERAVKLDPTHQKSLWLKGTVAFDTQDYVEAARIWRLLAATLPAGSEAAATMQANIVEAEALMNGETPVYASADTAPVASGPARITGTVTVAPALANRIPKGATLFVYAKAAQGPPMPLAIVKKTSNDLPLSFSLDESMAMAPGMSLARFNQVMVGARVSLSGNARAEDGDFQGIVGPIRVGSEGLSIVIDHVVGEAAPMQLPPDGIMTSADTPPAQLSGTVTVAPELAGRIPKGATLFVYAKSSQSPMPLAIIKKTSDDLPLAFTLDESMAMTPANSLASVKRVVLGARISLTGDAKAADGDFQGMIGPVTVGSDGLNLVINRVIGEQTAAAPMGAARPMMAPKAGSSTATGSTSVSGTVTVAPALASKVDDNATLFVFAKAAEGPPMPLAILKKRAGDLPLTFMLDETMAMMPAMSLARFPNVTLGARISTSGNAMAQPGDLEGRIGPVKVGSDGLSIVIDRVVQ